MLIREDHRCVIIVGLFLSHLITSFSSVHHMIPQDKYSRKCLKLYFLVAFYNPAIVEEKQRMVVNEKALSGIRE